MITVWAKSRLFEHLGLAGCVGRSGRSTESWPAALTGILLGSPLGASRSEVGDLEVQGT